MPRLSAVGVNRPGSLAPKTNRPSLSRSAGSTQSAIAELGGQASQIGRCGPAPNGAAEEDHGLPLRGIQHGDLSRDAASVGEEPLGLRLDLARILFREVSGDGGEHLVQRQVEVGTGDLPERLGVEDVLHSEHLHPLFQG